MKVQLFLPLLSLLPFGNSDLIETSFNCPNGQCTAIDDQECSSGGMEITPPVDWKIGTLWSNTAIDISDSFTLTTKLYFGTKNNNGADGIALVLQSQGPTVKGRKGEGLGFTGIKPSVAVEFDTHYNSNYGNAEFVNDHIALVEDGHIDGPIAGPFEVPAIPNFEDGQYHDMVFSWDSNAQTIFVSFDGHTIMNNELVDIASILGSNFGYLGFTAATGGLNNSHRVCIESLEGTAIRSFGKPKLCKSTGDPHYTTFGGTRFDNHESGWQTLYEFGAVKIEAEHAMVRTNRPNIMINRAWRVSYHGDIIEQGEDGTIPNNGGWILVHDPTVSIRIMARQPRGWSHHNYIYNIFVTTPHYNGASGLCADVDVNNTPPTFPENPNIDVHEAEAACQALAGTDAFDDCVADVRIIDDPDAVDDIVDIAVEAAIIEEKINQDLQEDDDPDTRDDPTLNPPTEAPVALPADPSAEYKVVSPSVGCGACYSIPDTFSDCQAAGESSEVQQARNIEQFCDKTTPLIDRTPFQGPWWNATAPCSIRVGENSCIWAHTGNFLYRDCTVGTCGTDDEVPLDTMIICKKDEVCASEAPTISTPSPTISTPSPTISTPSPTISTPSPTISTPSPTISTPSPTISTPSPTIATPSPTISTPSPTISTPSPTITTPSPTISTPSPTISTPSPTITTPPPTISTPKPTTDDSRSIGAQGDPIILGLKGQVFKFDGRDGGWYANIASKSFNWNMQFKKYPTCKEGSDVFISGIALITPRESDQQHQISESDILIATTPYPIEECRGADKHCLGDGTLHISFDGGATYVSQPGDYPYASRNRVVAHNTYGACSRQWHDYNITPKQNKFGRLGGRRVTVEEKKPLEMLMEKKETMINPKECLEWIQDRRIKGDLFEQKGLWSTLHVHSPSISFHVEYRQSNPEKSDRECDYKSLDAWMVNVSKDLEEETWQGILGETKDIVHDIEGKEVMSDRNAILRGSSDIDYEVDGPFGTTFNAKRKTSILPWLKMS